MNKPGPPSSTFCAHSLPGVEIDPADDLLSVLCTFEYEGEMLPEEEILGFCSFLLAAGVETTDRALSSLLKLLFSDRAVWEHLRADRDAISGACAEILRWAPPVHGVSRGVQTATDLAGQALDAGEKVFALIGSANRDEQHFTEPEVFDVERFAANPHREFTPKASISAFWRGQASLHRLAAREARNGGGHQSVARSLRVGTVRR